MQGQPAVLHLVLYSGEAKIEHCVNAEMVSAGLAKLLARVKVRLLLSHDWLGSVYLVPVSTKVGQKIHFVLQSSQSSAGCTLKSIHAA